MVFAPREHVDDANTPEHGGRDGAATRHLRWSMWQVTPAAPMGSTGEKACPIYATLCRVIFVLCSKARGVWGRDVFCASNKQDSLVCLCQRKSKIHQFPYVHGFYAILPA